MRVFNQKSQILLEIFSRSITLPYYMLEEDIEVAAELLKKTLEEIK